MKIAKLLIFCTLLIGLLACGKKTGQSGPNVTPPPRGEENPDQQVDLDVVMRGQKLVCEDRGECPSSIAKIVINARKEVKYCTGTLIDNQHLLTSAECLPKNLRINNINCSKSIFFVFAENTEHQSEVVACDKVVFADNNKFPNYPELWKSDIALLKLKLPSKRAPLKLNKRGINERFYKVWKVDTQTDKIGTLTKTNCQILRNSFVNPLSSNGFSNMQVAMDCELVLGNSGAPLLNRKMEVLGTFSKEMDEVHYNYLESANLLSEEIGSYYHFSNLSCLEFNVFHNFGGFTPRECNRVLTISMLNKKRSQLVFDTKLHQRQMERIQRKLERPDKYFKWNFEYIPFNNGRSFEAHIKTPNCIYRSSEWYKEFSYVRRRRRIWQATANIVINHKQYIFHTKFNRFLRPISVVEDDMNKSYEVSFTPMSAHRKGITDVTMTTGLFGRVSTNVFKDIEKCQ